MVNCEPKRPDAAYEHPSGANWNHRGEGLQVRETAALGATLGATRANDFPRFRTDMNSRQKGTRGHGRI